MEKRYITITSKEDLSEIERMYSDSSLSARVHKRSHAILLSNKGYSVPQLCDILEVNPPAIYRWFDRFELEGVSGLLDKARSGRPTTLSDCEKKNYS